MSPTDRSRKRRRVLRVVLSAAITVVMCVSYVIADILDVVPGLLTEQAVRMPRYASPAVALKSGMVIGTVARQRTIDAGAAGALIDQFAQSQGLGSDFSVVITDDLGDVVGGRDQNAAREPASTLKTLTALAVSNVLDMGSTLATSVYLDQTGEGAALTLSGSGDMLLGSGNSDSGHINGRAGLATLADGTAKALKQRGISRISFNYDDSLFGTVRSPDHISQNNQNDQFFAPISSMAVDGGRQWNGVQPSDPDVFDSYPTLSTHTASDAAQRFISLLRARGITVAGPAGSVSTGKTPSGLSPIASVHSATLGEIMAFMLRHSDNTLAEEFGRLLALRMGTDNSPAGAVQAVQKELKTLGLDMGGLVMADCSGLSPGSQVTATTLAQVQAHNLRAGKGAAAAEGLSIPGALGTAVDRLDDARAAGLMRVKTGSLDTVTAMAGNVSRLKGGTLAFAVIINKPQDMNAARSAIDTFIAKLVGL